MYVVPLLAFLIAKGRGYYLAPAYPSLLAAGAVWEELWVSSLSARRALAVSELIVAAIAITLAPKNSA